MISRLGLIALFIFWLASMAWLGWHDVWPAWTAVDAPRFDGGDWLTEETSQSQLRIVDQFKRRVGTVWTEYTENKARISRNDTVWIDGLGPVPMLRIEIDSDFTKEGHLDEIQMDLFGAGEKFKLLGERYSGHLAFKMDLGTRTQYFKVDAAAVGTVDSMFRPFATLPRLEVGQSWRTHVFNPLAALTGVGSKLIPMLVKVTGWESIKTDEGEAKCFVIEAGKARAWVKTNGVVVRQVVTLPIGGTLSIEAEPYNADRRDRIRQIDLPSGDEE
ncbi:MAG: hypothetical protein DHS20C16_00500 [Phycisphaerae bacterium]|nr:MAG: hypothetical protein DHS20C16_00500 [Phycisphaerae bacterium]